MPTSTSFAIPQSKASIVDIVYPVGSIYMSVASTSPSTLFGGTWVQLEDRFLLGASADNAQNPNHQAGDIGGAESVSYTPTGTVGSHTLTTDEIPSHSHGLNSHTHSYTYPTGTTTQNNGNTGSTTINFSNGHGCITMDGTKIYVGIKNYNTGWPSVDASAYFETNNRVNTGVATTYGLALAGSQAHTHTLNNHSHTVNTGSTSTGAASGNTESTGGGGSHSHSFTGTDTTIDTMPPFLAVYMWKRTA